MVIAIDFDGVIHNPADKEPGYKMGKPYPDTYKYLHTLRMLGHKIVVHTLWARTDAGTAAVEDWLRYFLIPFDEVTALKPAASIYIDDRAYRHTDWRDTMKFIVQVGKAEEQELGG